MKIGTLKRYVVRPKGQIDFDQVDTSFKEFGPKAFTENYIDAINSNTKQNGKFIVVDEEATKEYEQHCKDEREYKVLRREEERLLNAAVLARAGETALNNLTNGN